MTSHLYIQTGLRDKFTFLKKGYCTTPYKIANISEDRLDETLYLMLMTASPGILDNDEYYLHIEIEKDTKLEVRTQSFQRLFSMKKYASQRLELNLGENSCFSFIAHPVVPHKDASFTSTNIIKLEKNCTLKWGEILTCGRKMNGEVFEYLSYQNLTTIYISGKLILRENLIVHPLQNDIYAIGQFEGFTHQASFIFLNENIKMRQKIADIATWLDMQLHIEFGISHTSVNGFIIKILGNSGEHLFNLLNQINSTFLNLNNLRAHVN